MAIFTNWYNLFFVDFFNGQQNNSPTNLAQGQAVIQSMIALDSHVHDFDLDDLLNDVDAERATGELIGDDVAPGTQSLALDTGHSPARVELDVADYTHVAVNTGSTLGGCIIYDFNTDPTDSHLICSCDFTNGNVVSTGGDIQITVGVDGVGYIVVA